MCLCVCLYTCAWILLYFPQTTPPTLFHSFSHLHFNLLALVPGSTDLEDIKAKPVDVIVQTHKIVIIIFCGS